MKTEKPKKEKGKKVGRPPKPAGERSQTNYERGEKAGRNIGYGLGHAHGKNLGYREGMKEGTAQGYAHGHDVGFFEGLKCFATMAENSLAESLGVTRPELAECGSGRLPTWWTAALMTVFDFDIANQKLPETGMFHVKK